MPLRMTATGVTEVGTGIWEFDMPPHQVRHFGNTSHSFGARSVLMFRSHEYDAENKQLHFDLDEVAPINVGTSTKTIGIAALDDPKDKLNAMVADELRQPAFGPGDREFLDLARRELSENMAKAAKELLLGIRQKSAGDLKRGQARNFSETPDNFWYVIIQPRIDELSLTIRGPVDRFEGLTGVEIKDDRGNTRFKLRSQADVPDALQLVFHAIRKR